MTMTKTRIVTISRKGAQMARVGSLNFPIFTAAIYEARPRQRDGRWTWRLVEHVTGLARSARSEPSDKLVAEVAAYAAREGIPFKLGVRHGDSAMHLAPPEVQVAYILGARDLRVA